MTNSFEPEKVLPGLYLSAEQASLKAQAAYYHSLRAYLILLLTATLISFYWPRSPYAIIISALLFLITLAILVYIRVKRPDDVWYNARAVAESVKTRAWRWMMRAEPYENCKSIDIVSRKFIDDLKAILIQNQNLSDALEANSGIDAPITVAMKNIREKTLTERLEIYKKYRIDDQSNWYARKSMFNKLRARQWFWVSVFFHFGAILMLMYRILNPIASLPIEVFATTASAALTWLQSKKHNELNSSYTLAAHEIALIKGGAPSKVTEKKISDFVLNSENAFSREHTLWLARKSV